MTITLMIVMTIGIIILGLILAFLIWLNER